jgi:hypothetical protein
VLLLALGLVLIPLWNVLAALLAGNGLADGGLGAAGATPPDRLRRRRGARFAARPQRV